QVDLDGGGRHDLLAVNPATFSGASDQVAIYRNRILGLSTSAQVENGPGKCGFAIAQGDFDGDGLPDAIVGCPPLASSQQASLLLLHSDPSGSSTSAFDAPI